MSGAMLYLSHGIGGVGWVGTRPSAFGHGYGIALTWRKQASGVQAIEDRDGARFYFDRSSPFGAPKLVRTPGLRKIEPTPRSTAPAA